MAHRHQDFRAPGAEQQLQVQRNPAIHGHSFLSPIGNSGICVTCQTEDPCSRAFGIHAEQAPVEELEGADKEQWQQCQERLKGMGFEEEETDKLLRKAFGWAGQGYWRKSKVNEVPTQEQVRRRSRHERVSEHGRYNDFDSPDSSLRQHSSYPLHRQH